MLSIGTSFITANFINKNKPIDSKKLQIAYQNAMQQQLDEQKKELQARYEDEYEKKYEDKENTVENMCFQLANVIGSYYDKYKSDISVTKNVSLDNFIILFKNDKGSPVVDNDEKIQNIYTVNDTVSVINEGKTLRNSLIITIGYKSDEKFNINNNKLLMDYVNIILNRNITDDEKNAINIGVNMNLDDLSSIKDLKNYIYNNNQIKIDNSIISIKNYHPKINDNITNEIDDNTRNITELTIVTDEDNRFSENISPKDSTNIE